MLIRHFSFSLDSSRGGVTSGVMNLVEQLTKYGMGNQIISTGMTKKQFRANYERISEIESKGIQYKYTTARFKNDYGLGSLKDINRILKNLPQPDFVVLHQIYTVSTLLGYFYAKRNGIAYAVMPHGSLTKYHESVSRHRKSLVKFLIISKILREADAIIVTCDDEKSDLKVPLQAKTYQLKYGAEVSGTLNLVGPDFPEDEKKLRITFSGRFDKKKNLDLVIKAMPKILMEYPDLILDIAGWGDAREVKKVQDLISSLELEKSVQLHGWVDGSKMQKLFSASRLLVLPSENENFAIVVAEALSAGVPCVLSKFVGTADIVANHHAGEVIHELTPSSVACGILKILQGNEDKYREAAFEAVRESLDWSKIALQWKALIAALT